MFGLGTMELVLIFMVVVIIFGVGKLPEIGSGIGKAINGFKKGVSDDGVLKADNDNAKEKA
jgi:sec-independent protein translocase protein TatA